LNSQKPINFEVRTETKKSELLQRIHPPTGIWYFIRLLDIWYVERGHFRWASDKLCVQWEKSPLKIIKIRAEFSSKIVWVSYVRIRRLESPANQIGPMVFGPSCFLGIYLPGTMEQNKLESGTIRKRRVVESCARSR
jgi:hypothetical protein